MKILTRMENTYAYLRVYKTKNFKFKNKVEIYFILKTKFSLCKIFKNEDKINIKIIIVYRQFNFMSFIFLNKNKYAIFFKIFFKF